MPHSAIVKEIAPAPSRELLCPSAQPEMKDARVLGVMTGAPGKPELAYLSQSLAVTPELLATTAPSRPTEVLRFAAVCQEKACIHFDGSKCQLATRIVQILPAVTEALPPCIIRAQCRWFQQEGRPACERCPQVITETHQASEEFYRAAMGPASVIATTR